MNDERKNWKIGRLEDRKIGRLEDWKDGRSEEKVISKTLKKGKLVMRDAEENC